MDLTIFPSFHGYIISLNFHQRVFGEEKLGAKNSLQDASKTAQKMNFSELVNMVLGMRGSMNNQQGGSCWKVEAHWLVMDQRPVIQNSIRAQ